MKKARLALAFLLLFIQKQLSIDETGLGRYSTVSTSVNTVSTPAR